MLSHKTLYISSFPPRPDCTRPMPQILLQTSSSRRQTYSAPSFIRLFKLFATPKLALAITCLTALSNPPPLACSCASDSLFVFATRSFNSGPPSPRSEGGSAFVEIATMDDAIAMTSERCSLSAGVCVPVRIAARRFWIELTSADDCVSRYG